MSHFVMEIGTEELPARFLATVEKELQTRFAAELKDAMLDYERLEAHCTPRRSVLHIYGMPLSQPVREEVALGPSVKAAFDAEGKPTKAAQGFARGQGVDVAELFTTETEKGTYIAARKKVGGKSAAEVLAKICPAIITALPFPKRMRWGNGTFAYARPLHWIVALLDDAIIPFTVGTINSGRQSMGHRIHGAGPWTVDSADAFDAVMAEKGHVVLDGAARRKLIIEEGNKAAGAGKVLWLDSLLDEVQGLAEYPVPILGTFDASFLELPRQVLLTSMETHQKSFGVEDANGNLLPHFLTVLNLEPESRDVVRKGWERVLRARLEDARFYWQTDLKTGFETWMPMLDKVIFLGPLGSMGDKCRRLKGLCAWFAQQVKADANLAAKAGSLAKADLVSQMVGEFDTLQGIMGGIYGRKMGMEEPVALALQEQYLPAGPDSPVPSSDLGAILSLADKADTLVGCFGLGNIPTGAADPYALRRCALGIARILMEKGWRVSSSDIFAAAYSLYAEGIKWKLSREDVLAKLDEFFLGRVKNMFAAQNDTLLVEAVLAAGASDAGASGVGDVWAASRRLAALVAESRKDDFAANVQTFKRVTNIVKKQGGSLSGQWTESLFAADVERDLAAALTAFGTAFDALWAQDRFDEILTLMDGVRPVLDAFFDGVMVMDEDLKIRENRVNMLSALLLRMGRLADFSALQM